MTRDFKALQIRSDLTDILGKPEAEFREWFEPRREAVERLLHDYELFASIPHLGYETDPHTMSAITHVKDELQALRDGREYLYALAKARGYQIQE